MQKEEHMHELFVSARPHISELKEKKNKQTNKETRATSFFVRLLVVVGTVSTVCVFVQVIFVSLVFVSCIDLFVCISGLS